MAGAALGLSTVGTVVAVVGGNNDKKNDKLRAALWVQLTDALAALHEDPSDGDAAGVIRAALDSGKHGPDGLQVVTSVVGLHSGDTSLLNALRDANLDDAIVAAIADGPDASVRHGLELAGLLAARKALPVVLMRSDDADGEVRRLAVQALAKIAPATAIEHLLPRVCGMPPWGVEALAALLADGGTEAWMRKLDVRGSDTPRGLVDLVNVLTALSRDASPQRRRAAIDALGSIEHRLARTALASLVTSDDDISRSAASSVLSRVDSTTVSVVGLGAEVEVSKHEPAVVDA